MNPRKAANTHTPTHTLLPVLSVSICAARLRDLLSVLHPVALLVDAVGARQVALQSETVAFHGKRGVFGGGD